MLRTSEPVSRYLTLRYAAALVTLALIIALDPWLLLTGTNRLEQTTIEGLSRANHQYVYLERVGLLAWRLVSIEQPEVRKATRRALVQTAQSMEDELELPTALPPDLEADLRHTVERAQDLATRPASRLSKDDPEFLALDAQIEALLPRVGGYVDGREATLREQIVTLQRQEWGSFAARLGLLIVLALAVFRPMAQRIEAEFKQRETVEAQLRAYAERLEQNNRDLEEFAYVASHDLQEPLRKILAFGDRLARLHGEELSPEGSDYLQRMLNASRRMQALIQGLLTYSRVTTRARPFGEVDLKEIVDEVLEDLETVLEETGGEVHVGPLPQVKGDPLQMRQLLQNLIANALKFHRPDTPPQVRVEGRRRTINDQEGHTHEVTEIMVSDNGIGFDEKYLDRIFQPFQRLHGRTEYPGTGMGLAICRKIVERHHGTITARSRPGEGSSFIVRLPARQDHHEEVSEA